MTAPHVRPDPDAATLAAALELLSQPVTLSTAVRDAGGAAVDLRLTYLNAAARALQPDDSLVGVRCGERWPQMHTDGSLAACLRVLDTGTAENGYVSWAAGAGPRPGGYAYHVRRLGADTLLWELRDTGIEVFRAETLATVTTALAAADSPAEVHDVLITHGVTAVGADSGAAAVLDDATHQYVIMSGVNLAGHRPDRYVFDPDAPYPLATAARTGRALYFADAAARSAAFPQAQRFFDERHVSSAVLPLRVDERLLGAVSFHFAVPHAFDPAERAFLSALAGQCAQALERTTHRQESARAHTQLTTLASFSAALATSADEREVFAALLAAVVPETAEGALIHLASPAGEPELVANVHVDAGEQAAVQSLLDRFPPPGDAPTGVGRVLRTGEPEVITDPAAAFDRLARSPEHRAALATSGATSWLVAPIQHDGERLGVLTLIRGDGGVFAERDVPFAVDLGRRAAAAVRQVRTSARQREIAHALQQGLLPRALPEVPGLGFGSCYRTGERGLEVGGDFYDVFGTAPGVFAVTIGDVCGTGPVAASRTALVRHSSRAYGQLLPDPPAVTAAVNAALLQENLNGAFCSLAYATVDLTVDPIVMRLTLAGHPHPILRRADGSTEELGGSGTVLGVVRTPRHVETRHELHPGDTVVFYTDGATERRDGDAFLGEAGLHDLVAGAPDRSAAALVDHLRDEIIGYSDRPLGDDLAILAVRVDDLLSQRKLSHPGGEGTVRPMADRGPVQQPGADDVLLSVEFGGAAAVTEVRHALTAVVAAAGLTGQPAEDLVLAAHELVINAVSHGGGAGRLEVRLSDGVLICEVVDHGEPADPLSVRRPEATRPGGRGLWLAHRLTGSLLLTSRPDGVTASVSVCVSPSGSGTDVPLPRIR